LVWSSGPTLDGPHSSSEPRGRLSGHPGSRRRCLDRAALASVLQQSATPAEIIVVDDGSTDTTGPIAAGVPGVQVIRQANQERGAARNTGVRAARSTWLALLDADDEWLPNQLERAVETLVERQADVTCGAYEVVDSSGKLLWITRPWPAADFKDPLRVFERVQFGGLCASNIVARRALFEAFPFSQIREMSGAEDWHCFAWLCGAVSIEPFGGWRQLTLVAVQEPVERQPMTGRHDCAVRSLSLRQSRRATRQRGNSKTEENKKLSDQATHDGGVPSASTEPTIDKADLECSEPPSTSCGSSPEHTMT
jgi:hypothetical protein